MTPGINIMEKRDRRAPLTCAPWHRHDSVPERHCFVRLLDGESSYGFRALSLFLEEQKKKIEERARAVMPIKQWIGSYDRPSIVGALQKSLPPRQHNKIHKNDGNGNWSVDHGIVSITSAPALAHRKNESKLDGKLLHWWLFSFLT